MSAPTNPSRGASTTRQTDPEAAGLARAYIRLIAALADEEPDQSPPTHPIKPTRPDTDRGRQQ